MTYPIPDDALDDRLGFVGTAGSGKTYNSGTGVERVLAMGGRAIIPDPLGVWFGLALNEDGARPSPWRARDRLVIFGGEHGDLPLNEHHGALIGETAATMTESAILDLSGIGTKAAERRFMLAFLTAFHRHASGDPVHLIFDEADMWAPQRLMDKDGDAAKLLGMMETVVRRGRIKGFIPWLITQRPAVLSKDVLSQVDGLVAFKLTSSQDRAALGAWIEGQADVGQGKEILATLPTMQRGTGVVWIPGRNILATSDFPRKATFDSSRTPTRGERKQRRDLKPLELDKLKAKLSAVVEQAKANDPKLLKAEVARLTRELAAAQKGEAPAWPDRSGEVEDLQGEVGRLTAERDHFKGGFEEYRRRIHAALSALGAKTLDELDDEEWAAGLKRIQTAAPTPPQRRVTPALAPVQRQPAPVREPRQSEGNGAIPPGTRPTLSALASVYPSGMTRGQLAARVGIKKKGSTFSAYMSRLRTSGLIDERDGLIFASEHGVSSIGNVEPLPEPGPELARSWAGKLPGTGAIVESLLATHPVWRERSEVAETLGINPAGSTLSAYISRLSTAGVIEKSASAIRLSAEVMGE